MVLGRIWSGWIWPIPRRSLSLTNITDPSTFNCVARNPLGVANWTIRLEMLEGLSEAWRDQMVRVENRQGQIILHFASALPESLRRANQWTLRYSEDPGKQRILWSVLESEDRALEVCSDRDLN